MSKFQIYVQYQKDKCILSKRSHLELGLHIHRGNYYVCASETFSHRYTQIAVARVAPAPFAHSLLALSDIFKWYLRTWLWCHCFWATLGHRSCGQTSHCWDAPCSMPSWQLTTFLNSPWNMGEHSFCSCCLQSSWVLLSAQEKEQGRARQKKRAQSPFL